MLTQAAAKVAQAAGVVRHHVLTLKDELPAADLARRGDHTQQGFTHRALAATRFAYQAKDFATADVKRDTVHRTDIAQPGMIVTHRSRICSTVSWFVFTVVSVIIVHSRRLLVPGCSLLVGRRAALLSANRQPVTSNPQLYSWANRGLRISDRLSPNRLKESVTRLTITPGVVMSHQARRR